MGCLALARFTHATPVLTGAEMGCIALASFTHTHTHTHTHTPVLQKRQTAGAMPLLDRDR